MSDACCPASPQSPLPSTEAATDSCCELHPPVTCGPTKCPACGALGKPVKRITLGALLKSEARPRIPRQEEFCFCRTTTCEVVYFRTNEVLFRKGDLSVLVGLKESASPDAPACYCFGWTPQKIRAEIETAGRSTAVDQIKAQVKAGNCYCEVTNPQGSCCLGNVAKAVQEATAAISVKGGEQR